jgi:type IV pilus assembly protein PilC
MNHINKKDTSKILTKGDSSKIKKKKSLSTIDKINAYLLTLQRVPLKEKLFFVQHLIPMLRVGISLPKGLRTLSKQSGNKYFKLILTEVAEKVDSGETLANSIKPHKKVFGELFISMIETGEVSGNLEKVLEQLYLQMKKEHHLISKVRGALTYPTVILVAMFGIMTFMFVVVIPQMTEIFTEMNVDLPLATKILIKVSNTIADNLLMAVIIFVVVVLVFIKMIKTKKGKYVFDCFILKVPIVGPIIKKINLARFARNISSLLKTDIMIVNSFQVTANVLGNLSYRDAILDMGEKIKSGEKLYDTVQKYPKLFPPVVQQMIDVGEETGELDTILMELAEFYEGEVDQIMSDLPSLIEPLLILVLGVGVGGIAAAVIMPMYSLSSTI